MVSLKTVANIFILFDANTWNNNYEAVTIVTIILKSVKQMFKQQLVK